MATRQASSHGSSEEINTNEKYATMHHEDHTKGGARGEILDFANADFSHMSPEERATALKLAYEADPGPDVLSYRYLCFFLTCFVVIVNSCDTGFDTTIMSSVNSMTQFQSFFGLTGPTIGTGIVFVSPYWRAGIGCGADAGV